MNEDLIEEREENPESKARERCISRRGTAIICVGSLVCLTSMLGSVLIARNFAPPNLPIGSMTQQQKYIFQAGFVFGFSAFIGSIKVASYYVDTRMNKLGRGTYGQFIPDFDQKRSRMQSYLDQRIS